MRERLAILLIHETSPRITPARAGKTFAWHCCRSLRRNHPRSCGKDLLRVAGQPHSQESPPLVRERLPASFSSASLAGITPARAGKTLNVPLKKTSNGNHPRSCGKDLMGVPGNVAAGESPPLVRERLSAVQSIHPLVGITPARAGKTIFLTLAMLFIMNHPRSCGKDLSPRWGATNGLESPPLVRERLEILPLLKVRIGITPARAGKTVMDSFIFALLRLLTFKIYSTSLPNI